MLQLLAPVFFILWGSFLNSVGYRLTRNLTLWGRSECPHCHTRIAWHDLIPVLSWFMLRGRCRMCGDAISSLYPLIELTTVLSLTMLAYAMPPTYLFAYFIFFSGLIVTVRTDLELMLIPQHTTIALIPLALLASAMGYLPITFINCVTGAAIGFLTLKGISALARIRYGKEALGAGDADLLCYIGAFTGLMGIWTTLLIGSTLGSVVGGAYLLINKKSRHTPIPFGPFLAAGAMGYVLFLMHVAQ